MKHFVLALVAIFFCIRGVSQTTDTTITSQIYTPGLRISLLTCGTGGEIWETFGHTAVRITDSAAQPPFNDIVYNYGMFNGFDKDFELKFMRGKLNYFVATTFFGDFMEEYYEYGRSVQEQVLLLPNDSKQQIKAYLENNVLPSNRYYKYDFFFDNCATRIRDVFPRSLGADFRFGKTLKKNQQYSFRYIMNEYFHRRHWERVGVNILLGSKIDQIMSDKDIMFLPDYLRDGVAGATLRGVPVSTAPITLLAGSLQKPDGTNIPYIVTVLILLLTVGGHRIKSIKFIGRIMSVLLLTVSGLLGLFILIMWFGTDHQGCSNNYNLLWLLPTNLMLVFSRPKGRGRYSIIALCMLMVMFVIHFLGIQRIVPEFVPLMLALAKVYLATYSEAKTQSSPATN